LARTLVLSKLAADQSSLPGLLPLHQPPPTGHALPQPSSPAGTIGHGPGDQQVNVVQAVAQDRRTAP